jgi:hypothetical protein
MGRPACPENGDKALQVQELPRFAVTAVCDT